MSLHQNSGRWRLGLALSLISVLLWGILPIALAVLVQVLDVYTVIWFRFLVSFLLLSAYLGVRGELPKLRQLHSTAWKLLAIATLMLGANYLLFMQGLALTSPSNAEVLIQFAPLLLSFGGLVVFQERYTLRQWMGVGVLTCGYIIFFRDQLTNLISAHGAYIFGSGLVVLGAAVWAVYALAQKQLLQSLSSSKIMMLIYGGAALLFTPLAKPDTILNLNTLQAFMLIFSGLNTLISYGAFAESLEHWEASRVSAVLTLAPIVTLIAVELVAIFTPSLIPPENITAIGVIGACLVVAGSMAIALGKKNH